MRRRHGLELRDYKTHTDAWFVRSLSKNSYICADGYNAISYTKDERKQFTYSSPTLRSVRGIDVDMEGNVYIVGYESKNIHQTERTNKPSICMSFVISKL
jgi:hypothetical protein